MLEQEAKNKVCPFNLGVDCRGSLCMGWEATYKFFPNPDYNKGKPATSTQSRGGNTNAVSIKKLCDPPEGECVMIPPKDLYVELA